MFIKDFGLKEYTSVGEYHTTCMSPKVTSLITEKIILNLITLTIKILVLIHYIK